MQAPRSKQSAQLATCTESCFYRHISRTHTNFWILFQDFAAFSMLVGSCQRKGGEVRARSPCGRTHGHVCRPIFAVAVFVCLQLTNLPCSCRWLPKRRTSFCGTISTLSLFLEFLVRFYSYQCVRKSFSWQRPSFRGKMSTRALNALCSWNVVKVRTDFSRCFL